MTNKKITVGITAYTIFPGGGLTHFLYQAIRALSNVREDWRWQVIGSIALPDLGLHQSKNTMVEYWDGDRTSRMLSYWGNHALKIFGKGHDTGFLIQSFAERLHLRWGKPDYRISLLKKSDVIWIPHYNLSLDEISLNEDLRGVQSPVLLTIHDIHTSFYPDDHSADEINRYYRGFIPLAQKCQKIITHSNFQKTAIHNHIGINPNKIDVISQPPLIDPSILTDHPLDDRWKIFKSFGISLPFVFYPASTVHIHKNHIRLLIAWSFLKKQMGDHCPMLVCTGKGDRQQWNRLNNIIKTLGLGDKVVFTGSLDIHRLAILYHTSCMVVIPTLYEGAGSGILTDALNAGKLVVCSDIPQIREQINSIGSVMIKYFNPYQIDDIVKVIKTELENKDDVSQLIAENKRLARQSFYEMWNNWAAFYADNLEEMAV